MAERRTQGMCPHCGFLFPARGGLVPIHKWEKEPKVCVRCPGSEQAPRNPLSDRRPLWKDMTPEKEEAVTFREKPTEQVAVTEAGTNFHTWGRDNLEKLAAELTAETIRLRGELRNAENLLIRKSEALFIFADRAMWRQKFVLPGVFEWIWNGAAEWADPCTAADREAKATEACDRG